jgi:hypothetical protein
MLTRYVISRKLAITGDAVLRLTLLHGKPEISTGHHSGEFGPFS